MPNEIQSEVNLQNTLDTLNNGLNTEEASWGDHLKKSSHDKNISAGEWNELVIRTATLDSDLTKIVKSVTDLANKTGLGDIEGNRTNLVDAVNEMSEDVRNAAEVAVAAKDEANASAQLSKDASENAANSAQAAERAMSDARDVVAEVAVDVSAVNSRLSAAEARIESAHKAIEQFGIVEGQIDSSVALVKIVPSRSDTFAYINSIGGRTERYYQLLTNEFWRFGTTVASGKTVNHNGGTIKNNGDGTYTFNGTFESIWLSLFQSTPTDNLDEYDCLPVTPDESICVSLKNPFPSNVSAPFFSIYVRDSKNETSVPYNTGGPSDGDLFMYSGYRTFSSPKKYISSLGFGCGSCTLKNYVFAPMFNYGTSPRPWQPPADPFTGLRSGKVKALKVYGANLLNYNEWKNAVINNRNGTISSSVEWLSDGFSVSALSTGGYVNSIYKVNVIPNTTVSVIWDVVSNTNAMVYVFVNSGSLGSAPVNTAVSYSKGIATLPLPSDAEYITFRFSGADNKPTVYRNIRIAYTSEKVPYSPYTLTTYQIPATVRSSSGYGEGNPDNISEHNIVNFENEVFLKKGSVVNDTWSSSNSSAPKVEDISEKLEGAFTPVFPVEPNGRIEFINDYGYAVPSTITYHIT